jgi:hypothetical protein
VVHAACALQQWQDENGKNRGANERMGRAAVKAMRRTHQKSGQEVQIGQNGHRRDSER